MQCVIPDKYQHGQHFTVNQWFGIACWFLATTFSRVIVLSIYLKRKYLALYRLFQSAYVQICELNSAYDRCWFDEFFTSIVSGYTISGFCIVASLLLYILCSANCFIVFIYSQLIPNCHHQRLVLMALVTSTKFTSSPVFIMKWVHRYAASVSN